MLFTNGNYFVFLAAVFFFYWLLAAGRLPRNWLLLTASYYFYALWNPRFLALLFLISTFDFLNALAIGRARSRPLRKSLAGLSVLVNVGALFLFKYFNFFSSSLTDLLHKAGWHGSVPILANLVLPLGLSFIAFRSLSYVIDVYRGTIEPTRRFFDYLTFVAFFPTIIAGPLARAGDLLPQFRTQPHLSNEEGAQALFLIMIGLIKKIAIADFLANNLVDRVFDQLQLYSSVETLFAIYGYALQIYCDFSGYTDIAIGSALLLGIKLPANFKAPYQATSLRDFCRDHGAQLIVVTFPLLHALGPDYAYRSVHEQLASFWAGLSVPALDLYDVYAPYPPEQLVIGKRDAHPNRFAHELAAGAIGAFLEQHIAPRAMRARPVESREMIERPETGILGGP